MVDILSVAGAWQTFVSGRAHASATVLSDGLHLDYALDDTGGFVVARTALSLQFSRRFEVVLRVSGWLSGTVLELKLVSADGRDVWRCVIDHDPGAGDVILPGHRFAYAWGERGAGRPADVGAVEVAVVSGASRAGSLLLSAFVVRMLDAGVISHRVGADDVCLPAVVMPGPDGLVVDHGLALTFSAVELQFASLDAPVDVALEHADLANTVLATLTGVTASQVVVPLDNVDARRLRIRVSIPVRMAGFRGVEPDEASDANALAAWRAAHAPRGDFPACFLGEQVYWTCVSAPDATTQALINMHGMIEFGMASPMLEISWRTDGKRYTWADACVEVSFDPVLPMPVVRLRWDSLDVVVIPVRTRERLDIAWQWTNRGALPIEGEALVTMLPYQVSPPSQQYGRVGGVVPVHALVCSSGACRVNDEYWLVADASHGGWALASGAQHDVRGAMLSRDSQTCFDPLLQSAQAMAGWTLKLGPGETMTHYLAVGEGPYAPQRPEPDTFNANRAAVCEAWHRQFEHFSVVLPAAFSSRLGVWRTTLAHILCNRQGAMINPGPRRYARSWIRDAATMIEALLKAGIHAPVRDFLDFYAPFVRADGFVPCCVDERGEDPLVEHDSHGQWIAALMNYVDFTGDHAFLQRHSASLFRAADYIARARATRKTEKYCTAAHQAAFGLMPESVSHEGYLAQPVHAYWDDIWCLRGIQDAMRAAVLLNDASRVSRYREELADFVQCLRQSLEFVQRDRGLDFVPGSVEWADLDPSATAVAIAQMDLEEVFPEGSLDATMTHFIEQWRARCVDGRSIQKYSAYDIRVVRALINLDRRDEADALLRFLLQDQRPQAWHQWPEISWPGDTSAGHVGDLPHSWISAEFALAMRAALVEERGDVLWIARGIVREVLLAGEVVVRSLPTRFGVAGFRLWLASPTQLAFAWTAIVQSPGGVRLSVPFVLDDSTVLRNGSGSWVAVAPGKDTQCWNVRAYVGSDDVREGESA